MRIGLCIVLAAVHAARKRRTSPNHVLDSEAEVTYSRTPLDHALALSQVAGNRSLLQPKPPQEQAKAALAAAITEKAVARSQLAAETEFEALLGTAITEIMEKAKATAKASHDQVFHHGYYRAVKAETAAKAAVEAARKAIVAALQKAKVSAREVVFKTLMVHTKVHGDLGRGATVKQSLEHIEKEFKTHVKHATDKFQRHPEVDGLERFLEQMRAMLEHVRARKGQVFDSVAMTTMILGLYKATLDSLYFEVKVTHETGSLRRALQQDIQQEMSDKMKSEVGLARFLKYVRLMEEDLNLWKAQINEQISVKTTVLH